MKKLINTILCTTYPALDVLSQVGCAAFTYYG